MPVLLLGICEISKPHFVGGDLKPTGGSDSAIHGADHSSLKTKVPFWLYCLV